MPVIVGFTFGLILILSAGVAAAFGHGLYFPLGLFAAPFLWGAIGHGFRTNSPRWRILAMSLVIAQYLSAAILLLEKGQFADYEYWPRVPAIVHAWSITTIGLYLLGQVVYWWGIAAHSKRT